MKSEPSLREAVAVFDCWEDLEAAVDELQEHGFDRSYISLLARDDFVGQELSQTYERVEQLEDNPNVLRAAYVAKEDIGTEKGALIGTPLYVAGMVTAGAVVVGGGSVLAAILAALSAGSVAGLGGFFLSDLLDDYHAQHLQDQLERGGLLLWVRTFDREAETRAKNILTKNSAHDVHIHDLNQAPVVERYRSHDIQIFKTGIAAADGHVFSNVTKARKFLDDNLRTYIS